MPEEPVPYKFVPSRKANRKQYYLRKELLAIRDSLSEEFTEQLFYRILTLPLDSPSLNGLQKIKCLNLNAPVNQPVLNVDRASGSKVNEPRPLVRHRSTPEEHEKEIERWKKLLAHDNYEKHMKLAENLWSRQCRKEARLMQLKAETFLDDEEDHMLLPNPEKRAGDFGK